MNWKAINEKHPKAFLEWIRVHKNDKYIESVAEDGNFTFRLGYELSGFSYAHVNKMNDAIYQLPHYFDTLGVRIIINTQTYQDAWDCLIIEFGQGCERLYDLKGLIAKFPSRLAALEAGIIKAFEIRETAIGRKCLFVWGLVGFAWF